jgi:hypothetical protein
MMMARLELNDAAINELLHGPAGPVWRVTRHFADAVVAEVRANGPLGFDQGGTRATGLLRADMHIRTESVGPAGLSFEVGTDPANPKDGYHYARVIHEGRGPINPGRGKGPMIFMDRSGAHRRAATVGPADAQPFLYDAVAVANAGSEVKFILVKTG